MGRERRGYDRASTRYAAATAREGERETTTEEN